MIEHSQGTVKGRHSVTAATSSRNVHTFRSGPYLEKLMAELNRAEICRRIAQARDDATLTQPELADLMGVHYRTIQLWETGEKHKKTKEHRWTVPWDRLEEIGRITDVSRDWLLHGREFIAPAEGESVGLHVVLERLAALVSGAKEEREMLVELLKRLPKQPGKSQSEA